MYSNNKIEIKVEKKYLLFIINENLNFWIVITSFYNLII